MCVCVCVDVRARAGVPLCAHVPPARSSLCSILHKRALFLRINTSREELCVERSGSETLEVRGLSSPRDPSGGGVFLSFILSQSRRRIAAPEHAVQLADGGIYAND